MRRSLWVVLMFLCCGGCYGPQLGPTYALDGVYTDGATIHLLLKQQYWHQIMMLPACGPNIYESTFVDATMPFPDRQEQPAVLTPIAIVDTTGPDEVAVYQPALALQTWVRAMAQRHDGYPVTELSWSGLGKGHPTLAILDGLPWCNRDAAALSSSGRYLLVVDKDGTTIKDLKDNKVVYHGADSALSEMRALLAAKRNSVGHWFLTDDLHYVVAVPKLEIPQGAGYSVSGDSMCVVIAGVKVDLTLQAMVYDRQTKVLSTVPVATDSWEKERLVGVASMPQGLEFFYPDMVTDTNGGQIGIVPPHRHAVIGGNTTFGSDVENPLAWDAASHRVIREEVTANADCFPEEKNNHPTGFSYAINVIDYRSNKTTTALLDWKQIRDAVVTAVALPGKSR